MNAIRCRRCPGPTSAWRWALAPMSRWVAPRSRWSRATCSASARFTGWLLSPMVAALAIALNSASVVTKAPNGGATP